ncbi:MAG: ornithine carbamoyltransferase [Lentisphaerae bacterium]|nr:ornithine carbamoyltransferase [Lentisphaerota bacterium]
MYKDLLTLRDINAGELEELFELTAKLKSERGTFEGNTLKGKSIGMIFAKSSTRTRVSFEVGIHELGGHPMYLDQGRMQIGRGETVADTAHVLSRYIHGLVIRTYSQADVEELAREASFPVINALTDDYHPCQILADLFTIKEYSGTTKVKTVFMGDGASNIANSLMLGAKLSGMELVVASPKEYAPSAELLAECAPYASWCEDPVEAMRNADYVYTDVWVSMGFEEERARRMEILAPYQVNKALMGKANKNVKFLHCLPAHRGEEVAADVMDSDMSIVFDEAENRLHVQKAVMSMIYRNISK